MFHGRCNKLLGFKKLAANSRSSEIEARGFQPCAVYYCMRGHRHRYGVYRDGGFQTITLANCISGRCSAIFCSFGYMVLHAAQLGWKYLMQTRALSLTACFSWSTSLTFTRFLGPGTPYHPNCFWSLRRSLVSLFLNKKTSGYPLKKSIGWRLLCYSHVLFRKPKMY